MGGNQSTPSSPNPNPTSAACTVTMSSSDSPATHDSKPQSEPTHDSTPPASEAGVQGSSDPPPHRLENSEPKEAGDVPEGAAGEEEEEAECGFCLFMKAGGCKDEFIAWEKCVEEGDRENEDIAEKCFELTSTLKKCMEAHPDHYGPLLEAEKAAHEQARKEFEEEKEAMKRVEESAPAAEGSEKGEVLSASEQKIEAKDSVLSPSEQSKNQEERS